VINPRAVAMNIRIASVLVDDFKPKRVSRSDVPRNPHGDYALPVLEDRQRKARLTAAKPSNVQRAAGLCGKVVQTPSAQDDRAPFVSPQIGNTSLNGLIDES
jgi:hypothetical protein